MNKIDVNFILEKGRLLLFFFFEQRVVIGTYFWKFWKWFISFMVAGTDGKKSKGYLDQIIQ